MSRSGLIILGRSREGLVCVCGGNEDRRGRQQGLEAGGGLGRGLRRKRSKEALGSVSSECRFELLLNLPKICVS